MCTDVDFTMRKRAKDEEHNAYIKAMRIQFIDNLTQLPGKFFNLNSTDIPKGLLKNKTVQNYQKFIYAAFSFSTRYFLRTAENMVLSKPLRELKLSDWVHGVEADRQGHVTQESKDAVTRLKQWQEDIKDAFETDFAIETIVKSNSNARWFLEKRINKKYNDKVILAQAQAQIAKDMAEAAKAEKQPVTINFTMGQ